MRHHIFLFSPEEYYQTAFSDVLKEPGVLFQNDYLYKAGKVVKRMHSIHVLSRYSRRLNFPFRRIWFGQYFKEPYLKGDEYVFIFHYCWWRMFDQGYTDYLREKYPGCKCVLYLTDINSAKQLDIAAQKKRFDHIMVFEKAFAEKNGIEFYPLVYSFENVGFLSDERPIDLLFLGRAKQRYGILKKIYDRLTAQGVNCQFYMSEPDETVLDTDAGMHIYDSFIPYQMNIDLIKQSKCILDIVPHDTNCNTLRMCEAMAFGTRILTNNRHVFEEDYYNSEYISVINDVEDIDSSFLKRPFQTIDYQHKDIISSKVFIRHIDEVLFGKAK